MQVTPDQTAISSESNIYEILKSVKNDFAGKIFSSAPIKLGRSKIRETDPPITPLPDIGKHD